MKNIFVKNIHWFIIAYAASNIFSLYEEKEEELNRQKEVVPPLQAKIVRAKTSLKKIEEYKRNFEKTKERVKTVVLQIEKVQKQLPSDVNDTVVQSTISNIANDLKIQQASATPSKEDNLGFYFAKEYSFRGIGTFIQLLVFFENLEKQERILNVKGVNISLNDEKIGRFPILKLETTVESFRYNNTYKERTGIDEVDNN